MKLCFSGLERPIDLKPGLVTTLEVQNRVLFRRICSSLLSNEGRYAVEPYSLWEEDVELRPQDRFFFVNSPLELPWDRRELVNGLSKRMEELVLEDEAVRIDIETLAASMESSISQLALQLHSDYGFALNWDLKRYLKSFGFGVDAVADCTPFDNLINFFHLALDARVNSVFVFTNLKLFFSENEVRQLIEQMVFSGLSVLLLETVPDHSDYEVEQKYTIDQDLLESWLECQTEMPVSPQ